MASTTGNRPGAGAWPSRDGSATVPASFTPSSIVISTSCETLLNVGSGSFGGAAPSACAGASASKTAPTATASRLLLPAMARL